MKEYSTNRLILRECKITDSDTLYELSDALVMEYFGNEKITIDSIIKQIESYKTHHLTYGFGTLACINKSSNKLIGIAVLRCHNELEQFQNQIEIGWRIASVEWGKGYAGEIADKLFEISFCEYNFEKLIAIVSSKNIKSVRALEKLDMSINENSFIHPFRISELNPYQVYSMSKEKWKSKHQN